jgi:quercetin dioxygenase-like cupin family protein
LYQAEERVRYMKQVGKASDNDYLHVLEGIKRKTLVFGSSSLMTEFKLEKGRVLPLHKHPNEQTGYLITGHIILNIDGQNFEMHAGDSWCIPGDIEHGAEIIENSIAIEVFCPIREDYLLGRTL